MSVVLLYQQTSSYYMIVFHSGDQKAEISLKVVCTLHSFKSKARLTKDFSDKKF